jgi:membrane protein DedA with SNARE-associated domain
VVFFGRDILGLRAQIFLVSGVMKMSVTKFLVADAISALFPIGLWGGVGYLDGDSVQVLKKDATRVDHIAIVVFVIWIASGIIFRYLNNIRKFKKT